MKVAANSFQYRNTSFGPGHPGHPSHPRPGNKKLLVPVN